MIQALRAIRNRGLNIRHNFPSFQDRQELSIAVLQRIMADQCPKDRPVLAKDHHLPNGAGFKNPWDSWRDVTNMDFSRAWIRRLSRGASQPSEPAPTMQTRIPTFLPSRSTAKLRATWLGHACYYVEFPSGLRVIFDPVLRERFGPYTWLGPKRWTKLPCEVKDIPIIDVVVISHNHYDHLDSFTIKQIIIEHPNCRYFVPLKNKSWFVESGARPEQVTELDWWDTQEVDIDGINAEFGCLPCQHSSGRTPCDKEKTLWSSWSVKSGGKNVWFGGDTGYRSVPDLPPGEDDYGEGHDYPVCPAFKEIGDLSGPFDLGLIPIGAYNPRYLLSPLHSNPYDSVNLFKDVQCKRALAIHWGTWYLTEEPALEPPKMLKDALTRSGIAETGVFDVCEPGESREV